MIQSFGLEFDAFEEAMRGVDGHYLPVCRQKHDWQLQYIVLGDIELMKCQNGGGAIYEGGCRPSNFGIFFPLSRSRSLLVNGSSIAKCSLTWLAAGKQFHVYNSDLLQWVGITMGCSTVNRWLQLKADALPIEVMEHRVANASPVYLAALRDFVLRLFAVNESAPESLVSSLAASEAREQLMWRIYDAVRSTGQGGASKRGRPAVSRVGVLQRATALIDMRMGRPVYIADLCQAAGVSRVTLQKVFLENFGVSPHRYLVLARLRAIHAAIRAATPRDTVAGICERFGIWDVGRFASLYRRSYGVLPSAALAARARLGV